MSAEMVVDVGNTRMKWGRCVNQRVDAVVSLPLDNSSAWQHTWENWGRPNGLWAISGSHPERIATFVGWLQAQGQSVRVFDSHRQLDLEVAVEQPEKVGMDRLFNALAVKHRLQGQGPAVIVDAGSAVTVDYLDEAGSFIGGAIFPGLQLMARALHDHTAKLPLVNVAAALSPPGTSTGVAIEVGVFHAVLGGIEVLVQAYHQGTPKPPPVFLGGGDATLLAPGLQHPMTLWPAMTLEGIRATVDGVANFSADTHEPA